MTIGHQLSFAGQPLERLLFEVCRVAVDEVEDLWFQNKKRPVDPAFFGLRFFRELADLIALHFQVTKASGWPDSGQGG